MHFDLSQTSSAITYKLLAASIVPRPIAWLVTQSPEGDINAAPFSFFNVMGPEPPIVAVGINKDSERGTKDSARNILATGEFVVNLVTVALAKQMNLTAIDAPFGINELDLAGLTTVPSMTIKPPRIAQSPVALECVSETVLETGPHQYVVIGAVRGIHIDDQFVRDPARGHVDTVALDLLGRTFGSGYVRLTDRFDMQRPSWKASKAEGN
jgi:flavin reductase (DIM6/NTAB) family NADH-FMN oxidoreductase RutF